MNLFLWIVLSAAVGWLMTNKTQFGKPAAKQVELVLTVLGGLLTAYVLNYFGKVTLMGVDPVGDLVVVVGAGMTLTLYRLLASFLDHVA